MKLKCCFGIGTAKFNSVFVDDDENVWMPQSSAVACWSVESRTQLFWKRVHRDCISVMVPSPCKRFILTCGYQGEVHIFNSTFSALHGSHTFELDGIICATCTTHGAWSPNSQAVVVCAKTFCGILRTEPPPSAPHFELVRLFDRTAFAATWLGNEHLYLFGHDAACWVYGADGEPVRKFVLTAVPRPAVLCSAEAPAACAIARGREVTLFDRGEAAQPNGEVISTMVCQGSGDIRCLALLSDERVIVPSMDGVVACVRRLIVLWAVNVGDNGVAVYLGVSERGTDGQLSIWQCTESTLTKITLDESNKAESVNHHSYHHIACSGACVNPIYPAVATIDFSGRATVFTRAPHDSVAAGEAPAEFGVRVAELDSVGDSLRCLTWRPDCRAVLFGSLGGAVYEWEIPEEHLEGRSNLSVHTGPARKVLQFSSTITCMKFNHSFSTVCFMGQTGDSEEPENAFALCLGTSNGQLAIAVRPAATDDPEQPCEYRIQTCIIAHAPQTDNEDSNFGSISKFAEVWNLCFSPSGKMVATCSEDQTLRLWQHRGYSLHLVGSLAGHTAAVTCVDWREAADGSWVLATCADDRTVMVWVTEENESGVAEWKLHHVFNTFTVPGWHTITYLALEPATRLRGHLGRLCAVTQNGFVVIFDLDLKEATKGPLRLHLGSVEGLAWLPTGEICTCSGDCCALIFEP